MADKLINSFGYLVTGNFIVNIIRMGRDDFEFLYILKFKYCVRWGKFIKELGKKIIIMR